MVDLTRLGGLGLLVEQHNVSGWHLTNRFSAEGGMQIGLSTLGRSDWGPGTVCRSLD